MKMKRIGIIMFIILLLLTFSTSAVLAKAPNSIDANIQSGIHKIYLFNNIFKLLSIGVLIIGSLKRFFKLATFAAIVFGILYFINANPQILFKIQQLFS